MLDRLGNMILKLSNDDVGLFAVQTATGSEYILDLDKRTLTRKMAAVPPLVAYWTSALRGCAGTTQR